MYLRAPAGNPASISGGVSGGSDCFTEEEEMRILVTGGAGFIGSHVVDAYVSTGHEVAVLDDLSTGLRENLNPKARFHQMDLRDPALPELVKRENPEVVNHHAAQMSVKLSVEDPLFDASVNITGTLSLLESCRQAGVRKVIYSSSGGTVYGEPRRLPLDEGHQLAPISPYGVSKLAGEYYLNTYASSWGMECVILRYGNVYGPRQRPHGEAGVVAIFCLDLLAGRAPVIHWDGEQEKDYVYVEDCVRANVAGLAPGVSGVFNIGAGVGTSVNELYRHIAGFLDASEVKPVPGPRRTGDVRKIYLDTSRARDRLGWEPAVSLMEGLRRTAEFFRKSTSQGKQ
jgi:UDP-glucose 4-epimerase